jgi:hypothetical protein
MLNSLYITIKHGRSLQARTFMARLLSLNFATILNRFFFKIDVTSMDFTKDSKSTQTYGIFGKDHAYANITIVNIIMNEFHSSTSIFHP